MRFSRQEYWSGLPFPSPVDHIVSDFSTMPTHLGWPHRAWLSFIELDKAVVLVWLDWLVFCDYGFSVSALLQHLPSYLGFSYLGPGVSLHSCSSKAQLLLLTLDEGYLLTATSPDLECGIAPLGTPAPGQPQFLGCGVAPPGHQPWLRMLGSSSGLLLCFGSLVVSAAAPDLERLLLNHDTRILGPRRRRIQSGARDEAWWLRAFV